MVSSKVSCRRLGVAGWVAASLLLYADLGQATSFRLESVGVRGGLSANNDRQEFNQLEGFGNWSLPWGWDLGKGWHLQSRLDMSAGWLGDRGKDAAVGTLGPSVILSWTRLPLSLEGGSSPTLLSNHDFGSKNLGMDFQFTSHVGLNWDFARHWRLDYRFQHMSNAGLSSDNPGLNMHLFGLSFCF